MKTHIIFVVCILACAFIGFMCGYNFDHRSVNTGIFTMLSIMVSITATLMLKGIE